MPTKKATKATKAPKKITAVDLAKDVLRLLKAGRLMEAIMKNIIKHGEFRPELEKW